MPIRILTAICVFLFAFGEASAEYRVALLIGNAKSDDTSAASVEAELKSVATGLETFGFRCELATGLDEKKIKSTIESFSARTPTRSTALLYFSGKVSKGTFNAKPTTFLQGTNSRPGRGFALAEAFRYLETKGGSSQNLVVANVPEPPDKLQTEVNEGSLLAFSSESFAKELSGSDDLLATLRSNSVVQLSRLEDDATVSGKGSQAIASPEQFVTGKKAGDEWVNARGMIFCWCPPGAFTAGSPEGTPGRFPDEEQRPVTIIDGFWISKYELTLSQALRNVSRNTIARHKLDPLTMMNHDDAKSSTTRTFSQAERKAGRLPEDWQYSLPTEDQWEYAARAGTKGRFYFGEDLKLLPRHANFGDKSYFDSKDIFSNSADRSLSDGVVRLARVGSFEPNPWGLYDMYGNVSEWCINLAVRGGSWVSVPENCRSAYRDSFSSRNEQNFIGYRLVIQKTPETKMPKKK